MLFYSTFLSVKCCCHDISEDNLHTLVQTRRRHLFIGTRTGLKYTKTRMGVGMMDKRTITTLHELMVPKYHGCRRIRLNICCNHGCGVAHGAQ